MQRCVIRYCPWYRMSYWNRSARWLACACHSTQWAFVMSTRRSASMQKPDPAQNVVALRSSNLKRPVQLEGEEGAMQGKSISSDLLLIALAFFSWADWSKRHWHNTNSFALRSQSMDPKKNNSACLVTYRSFFKQLQKRWDCSSKA